MSPATSVGAMATTPVPSEFSPRLRLAIARLTRMLRQCADPGATLSLSLVSALATVDRVGPVTLGRLAEIERVQPPSMTRIAAQLEERGMLTRELDDRDRRVTRVRVTPAGADFLAQDRSRRNEFLGARLTQLNPEELQAIERALPAIERLAGLA